MKGVICLMLVLAGAMAYPSQDTLAARALTSHRNAKAIEEVLAYQQSRQLAAVQSEANKEILQNVCEFLYNMMVSPVCGLKEAAYDCSCVATVWSDLPCKAVPDDIKEREDKAFREQCEFFSNLTAAAICNVTTEKNAKVCHALKELKQHYFACQKYEGEDAQRIAAAVARFQGMEMMEKMARLSKADQEAAQKDICDRIYKIQDDGMCFTEEFSNSEPCGYMKEVETYFCTEEALTEKWWAFAFWGVAVAVGTALLFLG